MQQSSNVDFLTVRCHSKTPRRALSSGEDKNRQPLRRRLLWFPDRGEKCSHWKNVPPKQKAEKSAAADKQRGLISAAGFPPAGAEKRRFTSRLNIPAFPAFLTLFDLYSMNQTLGKVYFILKKSVRPSHSAAPPDL